MPTYPVYPYVSLDEDIVGPFIGLWGKRTAASFRFAAQPCALERQKGMAARSVITMRLLEGIVKDVLSQGLL